MRDILNIIIIKYIFNNLAYIVTKVTISFLPGRLIIWNYLIKLTLIIVIKYIIKFCDFDVHYIEIMYLDILGIMSLVFLSKIKII